MTTADAVKGILRDVLQLGKRADNFEPGTPLLGAIPELDSMAIVGLISAIEQSFGFSIEDDEISADAFQTVGTLCEFVERKRAA